MFTWDMKAEHRRLIAREPNYAQAEEFLRQIKRTAKGNKPSELLRVQCITKKDRRETWIIKRCPFCGLEHEHSAGEGARIAHCYFNELTRRPVIHQEYYLTLDDVTPPHKIMYPVVRPFWGVRKDMSRGNMKVRFAVLKRDGYRCKLCGATEANGVRIVVAHRVAHSLGGEYVEDNLFAACDPCNIGMGIEEP